MVSPFIHKGKFERLRFLDDTEINIDLVLSCLGSMSCYHTNQTPYHENVVEFHALSTLFLPYAERVVSSATY